VDCILEDRQQLSLQRAMVACRPLLEAARQLVGHVLDGKIHGHASASGLELVRNPKKRRDDVEATALPESALQLT
jgi:hypothetical protein